MVGQVTPGVWVLGFNHHAKKEDGGDDGPGPEPIPLNSKLWLSFGAPFCFHGYYVDVGVMINDLITSGEKGVEYSSKSSTIVTIVM